MIANSQCNAQHWYELKSRNCLHKSIIKCLQGTIAQLPWGLGRAVGLFWWWPVIFLCLAFRRTTQRLLAPVPAWAPQYLCSHASTFGKQPRVFVSDSSVGRSAGGAWLHIWARGAAPMLGCSDWTHSSLWTLPIWWFPTGDFNGASTSLFKVIYREIACSIKCLLFQ